MSKSEQTAPPYSVRIPISIREILENSARQNGRSLHAEILLRLEQSISLKLDAPKFGVSENIKDLSDFEGLTEAQERRVLEIVQAELKRQRNQ